MHRYPTARGLVVAQDQYRLPHHPRVRLPALNGVDVVEYFSLPAGAHDVMGSPAYTREINATALLPASLQALHPDPYVFWFSTDANARAFADNPWKYIPANGGHCTHGISTRGDLTAALVVDGRVAFTCVNTSKWYADGRGRNGAVLPTPARLHYTYLCALVLSPAALCRLPCDPGS